MLADRDWESWWQWALHYALWNMEMTDETRNAILNDKENKTPPSLTRRGMSIACKFLTISLNNMQSSI